MKRLLLAVLFLLGLSPSAFAQRTQTFMCDTSYQNCRVPLIATIDNEKVGVDVAMWFMEDMRYAYALVRAHKRGVRVRVIMNPRYSGKPMYPLTEMANAGIPMRYCKNFFHPKAMIFAGQGLLELGGANFTADATRPETPYVNYTDEAMAFTRDYAMVTSAMREFDNQWMNTNEFGNWANAPDSSLQRSYPLYPVLGDFVRQHEFTARLVALIRAETVGIDMIIYRAANDDVWHEIHLAQQRGVRVRVLTEHTVYYKWWTQTYLNPWKFVRGLWYAIALGGEVKTRTHAGLTHEKMTIFHGQQRVLSGSQNYNEEVGGHEWSLDFTLDPNVYTWALVHFNRKWNSPTEFARVTNPILWY